MSTAPSQYVEDAMEWKMRNTAATLSLAHHRLATYYARLERATAPVDVAMLVTNIERISVAIKRIEEL